jgi:glutathione synthase/RimK-type ligase-like ATP-grasp enzyme
MNVFFVVSEAGDWPIELPGITVVPARAYLMDPSYGESRSAKVFNLCRSTRYQSLGYYVSLLAEARGHAPLPDAQAMKDLQSADLVSDVMADLGVELGELLACTFAGCEEAAVDLDIYFGRAADGRYSHLCAQLFARLHAPLLHVRFEQANRRWTLCSLHAGNARDIPAHLRNFAAGAAADYLKQQGIRSGGAHGSLARVAILHDPQRAELPSNPAALQKFIEAAALLGMHAELITPKDTRRLHRFDALFIRDTTNVNHYTYRIAREAAAAGLVVIDHPDAILRCTNKIYLNEVLARHHIPTPKTLVVHRDNVDAIVPSLGLPCVLKQPDGAFSQGMAKIESEPQLAEQVAQMLKTSELVLAQEFLPTDFDWRIGVLDGRALFVCKYYMAPGHWQIIKHEPHRMSEGRTEALSVGEAPDEVVRTAIEAARLIGDGFYGVDLKQVGAQVCVIEINDNPNVDAGNEDAVLGDALYREVMGVFRKRIGELKGNAAS